MLIEDCDIDTNDDAICYSMFGHPLPAWGFYLRHADGIQFENVTMSLMAGESDERPPFFAEIHLSLRPWRRSDVFLTRCGQVRFVPKAEPQRRRDVWSRQRVRPMSLMRSLSFSVDSTLDRGRRSLGQRHRVFEVET